MNFLRNIFGGGENSAQLAKRRLQVVLVQDHLAMAPGTMEAIKAEIMEVISRHLEIDPEGIQIAVERRGHGDELVANIPVRRNVGTTRGGAPIPVARPPAPVRPARAAVPGARAAARRHR
ncbi:MAG TPA: cell division topological specificity factor MinE [Thermomicrobiales bacterium]|nr:cell division topological specificity factor MinE [Thermomicrobiales bacterium]